MNSNTSMHRNGILESVDLSQLQGEMSKLSPSVLRGIDGSTLHVITIPRSHDQEFIDHTMLSQEYIAAHIQNGLVVDIIQTPFSEQQEQSQHIFSNESMHAVSGTTGTSSTVLGRHFIANQDDQIASMTSNHSQMSDHISVNTESSIDANTGSTVIMGDQDRRLATAFLQYVQKQSPQLLANEAPVIVTNRELATLTPLGEIEMDNNFVTNIDSLDQSMETTKLSGGWNESDTKSETALPSLSSLAPMSKMEQCTMEELSQYKATEIPKEQKLIQNINEERITLIQSNGKCVRQLSVEAVGSTTAPKKNLPHKKRITKKLRDRQSISPSDDHNQLQILPKAQIASNVITNQYQICQSPQMTSAPVNFQQSAQIIQQVGTVDALINSNHCRNTLPVTTIASLPLSASTSSRQSIFSQYSCEICGIHCGNQLEFFNHLKVHYEPVLQRHDRIGDVKSNAQNGSMHDVLSANPMETAQNLVTSDVSGSLIIQQSSQNIYEVTVQPRSNGSCMNGNQMSAVILNNEFASLNSDSVENLTVPCGMSDNDRDDCDNDDAIDQFHAIKSEHNEFSDTEDMLEAGVVEKVQSTVDSYIENDSNEVKDIIRFDEDANHDRQQMNNINNRSCISITKDWLQRDSDDIISYDIGKAHSNHHATIETPHFAMHHHQQTHHTERAQHQHGEAQSLRLHATHPSMNSSVIEKLPAVNSTEEMTLIYEINVNHKDLSDHFSIIDDSGSESILRRQWLKPEKEISNGSAESANACDSITMTVPSDKHENETNETTLVMRSIHDEFIEEEKTDSESESTQPGSVRKKKKIFRCKQCNKLCNSKNALHYHFLSHTGERPHQCEICGKSFFASSALKVHKRLHSGDKPYECNFCNRPFRQWGDLKYHIQSRHTTEKNHQCEFCGKDFARRYSLVIHRRIHTGEKNYKCEFCDKQFRASSYLQVHRKIHTGEKPYVCDVCGKKFRVRGDLKRHSNMHERYKAKAANAEDHSIQSDQVYEMSDSKETQQLSDSKETNVQRGLATTSTNKSTEKDKLAIGKAKSKRQTKKVPDSKLLTNSHCKVELNGFTANAN